MAILILAQSEADFVTMGGPLDNAAHHSYEQVVIDHDIWEMAQRLTTEIVVDDDTLAYDVIEKVGPGGSFLGETHTRRAVQAGEHYYGGSFNHTGRTGEQYTMLARAHAAGRGDPRASRSSTARRQTRCSASRTTCATTPRRRVSPRRTGRSDASRGERMPFGNRRDGAPGCRSGRGWTMSMRPVATDYLAAERVDRLGTELVF